MPLPNPPRRLSPIGGIARPIGAPARPATPAARPVNAPPSPPRPPARPVVSMAPTARPAAPAARPVPVPATPAPKGRKPKEDEYPAAAIAAEKENIENQDLADFAENALIRYGRETLDRRAIPCIFDGLKTVTARGIYASRTIAKTKFIKTARLVGDMLGLYHPHGDQAASDALATAVTYSVPMFEGSGNWGTLLEPPAAMRYNELRLSNYGKTFMLPDYMAVTAMTPNYDASTEEPIFLPSIFPNILMNMSTGVATGANTMMPGFDPAELLRVTIRLMDGEDLTGPQMAKAMQPVHAWGGSCERTKANFDALSSLMVGTNRTSIRFVPDLIVDEQKLTITMVGSPPRLGRENFIEKVRNLSTVASCLDEGNEESITIRCKNRGITSQLFNATVEKVRKLGTTSSPFLMFVSSRTPQGEGKYTVKFHAWSVKEILQGWLKYRIWLEGAALEHRIQVLDGERHRCDLLILASQNIEAIARIIKTSKNPRDDIRKLLNIAEEDADLILGLTLRRLTVLDRTKYENKLKEIKRDLVKLKGLLKDPSVSVRASLEAAIPLFHTDFHFIKNCKQSRLTSLQPILEALGYGESETSVDEEDELDSENDSPL